MQMDNPKSPPKIKIRLKNNHITTITTTNVSVKIPLHLKTSTPPTTPIVLNKIPLRLKNPPPQQFHPFWKQDTTNHLSQHFWTPLKTQCSDLPNDQLDPSLKSWFSCRVQRNNQLDPIAYDSTLIDQLLPFQSLAIPSTPPIKVRQIKLLPNAPQTILLRQWFGTYRWIYNQGLQILKNHDYLLQTSLLQQLRNRLVSQDNYQNHDQWVTDLPYDARDYAIRELLQAFRTNLKSGHAFDMHYKSKKQSQSMEIRRRQYQTTRGSYHFIAQIKTTELLPELQHDIKLHLDTNGSFYLLIPLDTLRNENQVPHRMIAIDPGVRTLMTGYTPEGYVYHLGENDIGRLSRILYYKFKLQGQVKRHGRKNKNRIRHALKRMSLKLKHLVDECHKKLVHWLYNNFDLIILPQLETIRLCQQRKSRRTKNLIRVWRHGSLMDRMKYKNREYPTTQLLIPTEEYTSKTCCRCGRLNETLGKSKHFHCIGCGGEFDRDVNGAVNMLLKVLTEHTMII